MKLFRPDREALLVSRPNRFLIMARLLDAAGRPTAEVVPCHCPNPGRLIEFVIPGTRLILERRGNGPADARTAKPAKTAWTAVGLYYRDAVVPLYSARANAVARDLLIPRLIPDLREIRGEYVIGRSRFDFYGVDGHGTRHLVEVKACSLVEEGVAMFPDAPSLRAAKHLEELAELSREGYAPHVLFVVVHGSPGRFVPNLHTDPAFAAALSRHADRVAVHAALMRSDSRGEGFLAAAEVPVDLSHGALAEADSGSYLMVLELPQEAAVAVGSLGTLNFAPGWYVYAGSAMRSLSKRTARHLRRTGKKLHWHLDYLTPHAGRIKALPVASYRNLECSLASELAALGGEAVPAFGSSDCRCPSHLYRFDGNPMLDRRFVELLLRARHRDALVR